MNNDPFFDILNSVEGKIYNATLSISLKNARVNCSDKDDKWFPDLKDHFTKLLLSEEYNEALSWNVAGHLPQFGYLDFNWVSKMVNYIFLINDITNWKKSMWFYHHMVSTVYKDIFELLLKNGHYKLAIDKIKGSEKGVADFCKHIVISSTAKWEGQEITDPNSLINKLIVKNDLEQIKGVISFLNILKDENTEFIIALWEKIFLTNEFSNNNIYEELFSLVNAINKVDEKSFNLILSTLIRIKNKEKVQNHLRYINHESKSIFSFEMRAKLLMEGIAGKLNIHFIGNDFILLAKRLYETKDALADIFVESMVSKGLFNLLDVYNEYHT